MTTRSLLFAVVVGSLLAPVSALAPAPASGGEIRWRVSVKFILDADGERPSGNVSTDQDVFDQIDRANEILVAAGRGQLFDLIEIIEIAGAAGYHDWCDQAVLDDAAKLFPGAFFYRENMINIYVTDGACSASCAFPSSGTDVILVGANPLTTTFVHEVGHYMSLCHTQGCPCGSCEAGSTGACHTVPGNDDIDDTLPDLPCWDQDDISNWSFGTNYGNLSAAQQGRVDDVFHNVMSYHAARDRLTDDQLDQLSDTSNTDRANVASGRSVFVDEDFGGLFPNGSSARPYRTFVQGWDASELGDVLTVREGVYDEGPLFLNKCRLVVATRGSAVLR